MISDYLNRLKKRLKEKLPGPEIQFLMAPSVRQPIPAGLIREYCPRESGVLILLYPNKGDLCTVMIRRPGYSGVHSNQVSLPGGKKEKGDNHIVDTALREAHEEIGIDPGRIVVLGRLTDLYVPPSNFCISPVVGFTERRPEFQPDRREVAGLIEVSLKKLSDRNTVKTKKMILHDGFEADTPYYDIHGNVVWGATAMILSEFIFLLTESVYIK